MKKLFRKTISIFLLMAVVVSNLPLGTIVAGVRPSVSMSAPSTKTVEEGASVSYTIRFSSEDEINALENYVTLNGFDANITVSGSGSTRTIVLSNVQGTAGTKTISMKSGAAVNENGNSLATPPSESFTLVQKIVNDEVNNNANNNVNNNTNNNTNDNVNNNTNNNVVVNTQDKTRPSISVSSPSVKSVNVGGTVKFVITFADNKGVTSVNLSKDYINLNGFTANVDVTGSGNARTIVLSNVQGTAGTKTISIKAGAANDAAGNNSLATPVSESFTLNGAVVKGSVDETRPSVSISDPSAKKIYAGGTVTYVVTFADNRGVAKINLTDASYLVFNGFTADVKVTGTGNTRTVTLSNIQGEVGTNYNIVVKKGAAEDATGNLSIETPHSVSFQIVNKTQAAATNNNNKLDNEPNTGVESLPLLPIMGGAASVLAVAGYVITKKIYG